MIDYELAKELKDAGFPQWPDLIRGNVISKNGLEAYNPTLSELIEACELKTMYFGLEKHSNDWRAGNLGTGNLIDFVSAPTKEEAVACLWLALNKK